MNPLDLRSPDLPDATLIALLGLLWWSIVAVLVLLAAELVRFVGLTVRALRRSRLTVSSQIQHPNVTARL